MLTIENYPRWRIEVPPTAFTLTSDLDHQSQESYPYACKTSRSKVTRFKSLSETDERTDRLTDGGDCIRPTSRANAIGKNGWVFNFPFRVETDDNGRRARVRYSTVRSVRYERDPGEKTPTFVDTCPPAPDSLLWPRLTETAGLDSDGRSWIMLVMLVARAIHGH